MKGSTGARWGVLAVCALIGGGIGGTGLAVAAGPWGGGHGWGDGPWGPEHRLERLQHRVRDALDAVGATTAQEGRIHDTIAAAFKDGDDAREAHEAMRRQMLDLLRAPTIDRAAVEKLRADSVARFDARSKTMTDALLDAAGELTPEQRGKLAERFQATMDRHGAMGEGGGRRWGGPHGEMGGPGHPPPPPEDGHGGSGPDGAPDKG